MSQWWEGKWYDEDGCEVVIEKTTMPKTDCVYGKCQHFGALHTHGMKDDVAFCGEHVKWAVGNYKLKREAVATNYVGTWEYTAPRLFMVWEAPIGDWKCSVCNKQAGKWGSDAGIVCSECMNRRIVNLNAERVSKATNK